MFRSKVIPPSSVTELFHPHSDAIPRSSTSHEPNQGGRHANSACRLPLFCLPIPVYKKQVDLSCGNSNNSQDCAQEFTMAPGSRPSFIETRKLICFHCKGDLNVESAFEISHQNSERRGITEELEELQRDMVELNQVLSMVNRYTVKDAILAEINLISAKMESLREQPAQYSNKEPLWSDIVARRKKPPTTYHHKPQQIPVINNRYNLLSLSDSDTNSSSSSAGHQTTVSGVNIKRNKYKDPRKIIILGDSHARGCAQEVRHNLGKDLAVQGLVKPGAVSETIVSTANKITEKLAKKDVVMVWGGTRDVGRNESRKGLQQISNFVKKHNQTNVIAIGVPYRHDLEPDSCVNEEVKVFNRKLTKHLKVFSNTRVIEVESSRDFFYKTRSSYEH